VVGDAVVRAVAAVSATEWLGVTLALAYLVLAVRQSAWCWLFAATSSGVYLWLFARAGLTMQAALQVFYIAMAVYGWLMWRHRPDESAAGLPVTRWPLKYHALAVAAIAAATVVNVALLRARASSPAGVLVPTVDAFVAWGSVLATWMVARKVLENWLYWIALDLVAAALYGSQGLHATAVLFVLYAVIAVRGFHAWRATVRDARSLPSRAAGAQG
jgi:nicotinamide mononucleotide transporter